MWLNAIAIIVLTITASYGMVMAMGALRWRLGTRALRTELESVRLPITPSTFNFKEIEGLPRPVQRYFRAVLKEGQPLIAVARVTHNGLFNMSESAEKWRRFVSNQQVLTQRPGFDWNSRITIIPGIKVYVHDAYIAGDGVLHAALLGLIPLAHVRGSREAAQGELMRFLAEALWYPTKLLPSQGVRWDTKDNSSATATLRDGDCTVSLEFHFNGDGLVDTLRAETRARIVNGEVTHSPWQVRVWGYERRHGMLVPMEGEVAWELPERLLPYWRGRITHINFELAP